MNKMMLGLVLLGVAGSVFAADFKHVRNNQSLHMQIDYLLSNKGLENGNGLKLVKKVTRPDGTVHTRYKQYVNGLPVYGQDVIINEKAGERKFAGTMLENVKLVKNEKAIANFSAQDALNLAKSYHLKTKSLKGHEFRNESSELVLFVDDNGVAHQAYATSFFNDSGAPMRPFTMIDAVSQEVIATWQGLAHHGEEAAEMTGPGGNEKTGEDHYGADFESMVVSKTASAQCSFENDHVKTVALNHASSNSRSSAFVATCGEN